MKTLILILLISIQSIAQSNLLTLFSGDITYNGSELIPDALNTGFEIGSEIMLNGTFPNTNNWNLHATYTVGSGTLNWDALANAVSAKHNITIAANKTYKLTYTILNTTQARFGVLNNAGDVFYVAITDYTNGTYKKTFSTTATSSTLAWFSYNNNGGTTYSMDDVSLKLFPNYTAAGNHSIDSSSTYKRTGTYSFAITASAGGNGTTNTVALPSGFFTAVTNGSNYRLKLYAYTTTAATTLTFKLGDIVKTAIVSTTGLTEIDFDFKATASTTGNIILYLDKAATVYIDDVSLKSGS